MRRVVLYGLAGGVLIALLKVLEYRHLVHAYPGELYSGLIAAVFAAVGIHFGMRWARRREVVVVREVPVVREVAVARPAAAAFTPDRQRLAELGITPREHQILGLIAEGLSNREIGERAFISENTVKTHSSRLFDKLGVKRRVQAVQRGRELGLIR